MIFMNKNNIFVNWNINTIETKWNPKQNCTFVQWERNKPLTERERGLQLLFPYRRTGAANQSTNQRNEELSQHAVNSSDTPSHGWWWRRPRYVIASCSGKDQQLQVKTLFATTLYSGTTHRVTERTFRFKYANPCFAWISCESCPVELSRIWTKWQQMYWTEEKP